MRRAIFATPRRSMRKPGSGRSRARSGVKAALAAAMVAGAVGAPAASAQEGLRPYRIAGNAIPDSLTGAAGDPARGRAIVVKRESTCLLCHSGPFPEERFQGDLSPDLKGTGA